MNVIPERLKLLSRTIQNEEEFKSYLACLKLFWNQKYEQCLTSLNEILLSTNQSKYTFNLYRLHIEVLALRKDVYSLQLVKQHLLKRSSESENPITWMALIGLIYLELDEWEACELFFIALKDRYDCPYCLEFLQRFHMRVKPEDEGISIDLEYYQNELTDYFHWIYLARGYLLCGADRELEAILKFSHLRFTDSPMSDEFYCRLSLDDLEVAESYAQNLKTKYPQNNDYIYLFAYIKKELGEYKTSIKLYNHLLQRLPNDPDILVELAHCHFVQSEKDVYSSHWEKAKNFFKLAKREYRALGYPTTEIFHHEYMMKTVEGDNNHIATQGSQIDFWVLKLSQRRAYEVLSSEIDDMRVLFKTLPEKMKDHDYVFVMYEDGMTNDSVKLISIYQIGVGSKWHPYQGGQTILNLVAIYDKRVSIANIETRDEDRRDKLRMDDPKNYACFKIDGSGVSLIRESIEREFSNEIDNSSQDLDVKAS